MNEIVITNANGQLTTSSLGVAEKFEKQHKHVIEAIENLKAENSALKNMFIEGVYKVDGNNRNYKCYDITRDGFSLLVMGFTGKKALEWKLKYIEAFNLMEQKLKNGYAWFTPDFIRQTITDVVQEYLPKPNIKKINTWKAQVAKPLVNRIHDVTNAPIENIYKAIYIAMQDIYGFNQCYAITSYCDKYNLETCSVIDAIADNIEYQEQFINGIKRVVDVVSISDKINLQLVIDKTNNYNDFDDQEVDEDEVFAENGIKEEDVDAFFYVLEPLAEKYNDHSMYHVATLRKVYKRMKSAQSWKILKTRRKCSTIKEVIDNDPKLIKLYDDTIAEMLAEFDE